MGNGGQVANGLQDQRERQALREGAEQGRRRRSVAELGEQMGDQRMVDDRERH
jgi:hypothetical protein